MNKRNVGLDLLRLLAMFMIVLVHVNNWGGLLKNTSFQIDFLPVYILEAFSICSVNCFILISGFFLIKQNFRLKKLIALIFEIMFYTWICFIVALIIKTPMDITMFVKGLFTISTGIHWFITCYIMLYIFFPFINKLIYSLSLKQKHFLAIITVLFFSVWAFVPKINSQTVHSGYSILWVSVLYYWGAYIRLVFVEGEKNHLFKKIVKFSGYGYIFFSLITVIFICTLNLTGNEIWFALRYNSLFVFVASICLFIFMYNLEIENNFTKKLITFLAPAAFGVFLLSDNFFVVYYQRILLNKEFFLQSFSMPIMILICAVSIFLFCLCISKLLHKRIFGFSDKHLYPNIERIGIKIKNKFLKV
jgi:surface polysaccharide O-acyltransferase-like enzyme